MSLVRPEMGVPGHLAPSTFRIMDDVEFIPHVKMDENRVRDALFAREQWLLSDNLDPHSLDYKNVSLLEVVILLSNDLSFLCEDLVSNSSMGRWFREMMANLGINYHQSEGEQRRIFEKLVARKYGSDGSGGLFPLQNPKEDQTEIELWMQANEYIIENYLPLHF